MLPPLSRLSVPFAKGINYFYGFGLAWQRQRLLSVPFAKGHQLLPLAKFDNANHLLTRPLVEIAQFRQLCQIRVNLRRIYHMSAQ